MTYNLLASINWVSFGWALLIVAVLGLVFTTLILIISKYCAVKENPKITEVQEYLSGANCGGCGFAGCADFAKAVVEGRAEINGCSSTSNENKKKIASVLGVEVEDSVPMMAVVACSGDNLQAVKKFEYVGNEACEAKAVCFGGDKLCNYGCLGGGSCVLKCPYGAISVENGVAKVDKTLCVGCGACAKGCPKKVIELVPTTVKVYIACSSECKGKDVMNSCKAGCIGCGLCAKNCPNGAITMVNNLPVIDYSKCNGCLSCVAKCPKKIIKKI